MILRAVFCLLVSFCSINSSFSIYDKPVSDVSLQDVFYNLKKQQSVPEAVSLHNVSLCSFVAYLARAAYFPIEQKVKLSFDFYINPQSRKLFTLKHELAHANQLKADKLKQKNEHEMYVYFNKLIDDFVNNRPYYKETYPMTQATFVKVFRKAVEYNADKTACAYTDCPTCLTVAQRPSFLIPFYCDMFYPLDRLYRYNKGYFDERDFDSYVQERLNQGNYCKAHDDSMFKSLTEYLAHRPFFPIKIVCHKVLSCMDRMSGTLQDRLVI